MKVIAIILARKGSKGIKNKNIKKLCGKPLVEYSINSAKESKLIDEIYVSTDSSKIKKIAKKNGVIVVDRPKRLSGDNVPGLVVLKETISKTDGDIIVELQPTNPIRNPKDIDKAILKLIESGCDTVVSVSRFNKKLCSIVEIEGENIKILNEEFKRRQELKKKYWIDGSIVVHKRKSILLSKKPIGKTTKAIIVPKEYSIDIDDIDDFRIAEWRLSKK